MGTAHRHQDPTMPAASHRPWWWQKRTGAHSVSGAQQSAGHRHSSRRGRAGRVATWSGAMALAAGGVLAVVGSVASASGSPTLITVPASQTITLGQSNTDTATMAVTGTDSGLPSMGTATFGECGPLPSVPATGGCGTATVTTFDPDVSLVANAQDTEFSATSTAFTPSQSGVYCFAATYNPPPTIAFLSRAHGTSGTPTNTVTTTVDNECFTVEAGIPTPNPVPTPTPAPSDSMTAAVSPTTVTVGGATTDTALVSGTGDGSPTGSVSFAVCGPTASAVACSTDANDAVADGSSDLGSGNTTAGDIAHSTGSGTASATSPSFVAPSAGTFCFVATYGGNGVYAPVTVNATATQCFVAVAAVTTPTTPTKSTVPPAASTPTTKAAGSSSTPVTPATSAASSATPVTAASTGSAIAGATTVHTGMWWAGSTPWVLATASAGLVLLGLGALSRRRRPTPARTGSRMR